MTDIDDHEASQKDLVDLAATLEQRVGERTREPQAGLHASQNAPGA